MIFWPTKAEIKLGWRKLRYEKLHTQYFPLCIDTITKFRRIRQTGVAADMEKTRNAHEILAKNLKKRVPKRRQMIALSE